MALPTGVRKLESGRFQWRAEVRGQRRTGSAQTPHQAAQDRAQAIIELGGIPSGDPTVGDLLSAWCATVEHARRTAENRDYALAMIPSTFLARQANTVTPPIVAALWRELEADGVGATTMQKIRGFLSQAWQQGIAYGQVSVNPVRAVRRPTKQATSIKPEDVPSRTQVLALIDHLSRTESPETAMWAEMMAVTGARPGEVAALRWEVVDFDAGTIRLGANLDRDRTLTDGKNGTKGWRTVDIDHTTLAKLATIERRSPWVFTARRGDMPASPDATATIVREAVRALGYRFRPYDLRHFFASQALAHRVPVPDVAYVMGDNPATVLRVYAHFIKGDRNEAVSVVADVLRPTASNVVELRAQQ